jgi:hypothetical protein
MGSGAKSYMRMGFLIYEEKRKYLTIYEEAVIHKRLCTRSYMNFLIYEENLYFLFYQCMVWLYRQSIPKTREGSLCLAPVDYYLS